MTTLQDEKMAVMVAELGPGLGTVGDYEVEYVKAISGAVDLPTAQQAWMAFWDEQLVAPGVYNDRAYEWLGDFGFTGSLNDRWMAYWLGGGGAVEDDNLYVNFELAGGDPPTAHTVGFGTALYSFDDIGSGYFEFFSNTSAISARAYLQYVVAVNNLALVVGNTYRFSVECENVSGNNYAAALNLASVANVTVGNTNTTSPPNLTVDLFAEFVVDTAGYTINIRYGTGTTSNNATVMKFRRPKLFDLGVI